MKLTIINNGSHAGEDEDDDWMIMPVVVVIAIWLVLRMRREFFSEGELDWAKIILFVGVLCNLMALVLKGIGMVLYYFYGDDSGVLEVLYLIFHACS